MEKQLKIGDYVLCFYTKPIRKSNLAGILFKYDFGSFLHMGGFYLLGLYIALTKTNKDGKNK
jgi:hypothetical protein